ncbi:hypothetical protein OIO90_001270 [Microbotryomycetes sp. JL221]|nr:hypothetical protein OIO90_001270 [Microbotryomycetes sp. JL221]
MATYSPFIVVPPLTTCTQTYLLVGQGRAPYSIQVLPTGTTNGTVLEFIPPVADDKPIKWTVGFNEGANITFLLTDAQGQTAYSEYRVVQRQLDTGVTTCPRNTYTKTGSSTNVGAAVGGALAGVFVILIVIVAFMLHRRHQNKESSNDESRPETPHEARWRERQDEGGVVRRGTFNLRHLPGVQLNEDSVDALRMSEPPPPRYVAPEPKQDSDDEEDASVTSSQVVTRSRTRSSATHGQDTSVPPDTIVELPTVSR